MDADIIKNERRPGGNSRETREPYGFLKIETFLGRCIEILVLAGLLLSLYSCGRSIHQRSGGNFPLIPGTAKGYAELKQDMERLLPLYQHDPEMQRAAALLLDNLPLADLAAMTLEDLREHIDYAFLARRTFPWSRNVPFSIFLHYVAPHRVSQEPAVPWRKYFFEELGPVFIHCRTLKEAALGLNKWCYSKAPSKPSTPWDLDPLATIRFGGGRCEERAILYICAARSLGIPARIASTPAWQHIDDNHAWVEVWWQGAWHYLGAAEPSLDLDRGPFDKNLQKAALILSTAYGELEDKDTEEKIYRRRKGHTIFNTTSRYVPMGTLEVSVVGADGLPSVGTEVFVSIYNYGHFRPIASLICDQSGSGTLGLGRCTVLLSTASGKKRDFAFAEILPKKTTTVTLDLRRERLPEGVHRMRFSGESDSGPKAAQVQSGEQKALESEKRRLSAERESRENRLRRLLGAYLGITEDDREAWERPLTKALLSSGSHLPELLRALSVNPPDLKENFENHLSGLNPKDLVAVSCPDLLADLQHAAEARKQFLSTGSCEYEDEIFESYVLDNRVHYEPWSQWRTFLRESFSGPSGGDITTWVRKINQYVRGLDKRSRGFFGPFMTPSQVVKSGVIGVEEERATTAVGILRAMGIPARYLSNWGWAEFYDGDRWVPLYPERPEWLGNRSADPSSSRMYGERVHLEIDFNNQGNKKMAYGRDFTISRFLDKGYFRAIDPEDEIKEEGARYLLTIPAGNYFLMVGYRNSEGEPLVVVKPFTCSPGLKKVLTVNDEPSWLWDQGRR
ncbi:MAG: transglutaminase domain-containing protein [Pseudomonadota bacterium]